IGVNAAGAPFAPSGAGNFQQLVSLQDGAKRNVVGGSTDAEGNVIAGGGGDGIVALGGSLYSFIGRNWIGLTPDGAPAGNQGNGITAGSDRMFILGNRIAFNQRAGVT